MSKVDRTWLAGWMKDHSGGTLSNTEVEILDAKDERLILDVLLMHLKMTGTETLPKACQDPEVLSKFMELRMAQVPGEHICDWVSKAVTKPGMEVDWWLGSAFHLEFNGDRAVKCRHRSGMEVAILKEYIGKDYEIVSPCSDEFATAKNGASSVVLCKLFPAKTGPNDSGLDKKNEQLKHLVAQAVASVNLRRSSTAPSATAQELVLKDHAKERRTEALRKARDRLASQPKRGRSFAAAKPAEE
jgi:hypothetical protein